MMAAILKSAILDSVILHKKNFHSCILTELNDGNHLEFFHHWILPCWIQTFCTNLWIQTPCYLLSDSLKNTLPPLWPCTQTNSIWLNLMMATILNSAILDSDTAILDSDTLVSSLRFPQKHSHSILTLTQTNSISLKLIHSHSNWWLQESWILLSLIQPFCTKKTSLVLSDSSWWWQLSWILPYWIQTLPSWIQTPWYLLSDSLKKHSHSILTLTQTNSIWLKLIHSHLTWWWQSYWILPSWIQPS